MKLNPSTKYLIAAVLILITFIIVTFLIINDSIIVPIDDSFKSIITMFFGGLTALIFARAYFLRLEETKG